MTLREVEERVRQLIQLARTPGPSKVRLLDDCIADLAVLLADIERARLLGVDKC